MAQEARKPIFHLKPADGAIGAHVNAVRNTRKDFEKLARAIMTRAQIIVDNPDLPLSQGSLL
jgi:chromosome partitioning protein